MRNPFVQPCRSRLEIVSASLREMIEILHQSLEALQKFQEQQTSVPVKDLQDLIPTFDFSPGKLHKGVIAVPHFLEQIVCD